MPSDFRTTDLVALFLSDCCYRNLSPKTIKDYGSFLRDLEKNLGDLLKLNRTDVKTYVLNRLNLGLSPFTVNHYVKAIKVYYAFLEREEIITDNPMKSLRKVSEPQLLKPVLLPTDIAKMMAHIPERGYYRLRDRATLILLWDTAIRMNECRSILIEDVDPLARTIKVHGKGRKDRIVYFGIKARRELVRFMQARRNIHSDLLFCTKDGLKIGERNFERTIERLGEAVGIKAMPHLIRHSSATYLAKVGIPSQHLQIMLGHASLAVTTNYINRIVAQEGLQLSHRRLSPGDNL